MDGRLHTAVIKDYVRSAKVQQISKCEGKVTYCVAKKDFRLKQADVQACDAAGTLIETKSVDANINGECTLVLPL